MPRYIYIFLCHNGDISHITFANGVYVIPVRELHKTPLAGNINGQGPCAAATPEQLAAEAEADSPAAATATGAAPISDNIISMEQGGKPPQYGYSLVHIHLLSRK